MVQGNAKRTHRGPSTVSEASTITVGGNGHATSDVDSLADGNGNGAGGRPRLDSRNLRISMDGMEVDRERSTVSEISLEEERMRRQLDDPMISPLLPPLEDMSAGIGSLSLGSMFSRQDGDMHPAQRGGSMEDRTDSGLNSLRDHRRHNPALSGQSDTNTWASSLGDRGGLDMLGGSASYVSSRTESFDDNRLGDGIFGGGVLGALHGPSGGDSLLGPTPGMISSSQAHRAWTAPLFGDDGGQGQHRDGGQQGSGGGPRHYNPWGATTETTAAAWTTTTATPDRTSTQMSLSGSDGARFEHGSPRMEGGAGGSGMMSGRMGFDGPSSPLRAPQPSGSRLQHPPMSSSGMFGQPQQQQQQQSAHHMRGLSEPSPIRGRFSSSSPPFMMDGVQGWYGQGAAGVGPGGPQGMGSGGHYLPMEPMFGHGPGPGGVWMGGPMGGPFGGGMMPQGGQGGFRGQYQGAGPAGYGAGFGGPMMYPPQQHPGTQGSGGASTGSGMGSGPARTSPGRTEGSASQGAPGF